MKYLKDIREKHPDLDNATSRQVIKHLIAVVRQATGHVIRERHLLYDKNSGMLSRFVDISPGLNYSGVPAGAGPGREVVCETNMVMSIRFLIKESALNLEVVVPRTYYFTQSPERNWRTLEGFVAGLQELKIKSPIDFADRKLGARIATTNCWECQAHDDWARFSDFGRPVAVINALIKDLGAEPLKQDITNPLLAKIQNIHENASYVCRFTEKKISQIYNEGDHGEHGSCMSRKPVSFFELYDYLQDEGKLKLIELVNAAGVRYGRALCWFGTNPDEAYLDRIYCPMPNGQRDPDAVDAFKDFCMANNITKSVWGDQPSCMNLEIRSRVFIPVGKPHDYFNRFPYIDSMSEWFSDNSLGNDSSSRKSGAYCVGSMQNTDGTSDFGGSDEDESGRVTMYDGERMDEDDAYYVDRHGEHYYGHQVVEAFGSGDWELMSECVELDTQYYDSGNMVHESDAVRTHNDTYIRDADAITLHNGSYAHRDAVVYVDGDYYLSDDDDIIEIDGVWKLKADVEEEEPEAA